MGNRDIIQQSLDYIEEHLKTEITVEELAYEAGFSVFHYYRVFQAEVGMPVMQYVQSRRLAHAIYDIGAGTKMIESALAYGFGTHAGFFKAFKRAYDCSPTNYLKWLTPKKPYKIILKQEGYIMITHKKVQQLLVNWALENEKVSDMYYEGTKDKNEKTFYVGEDYVMQIADNLITLKNHIDVSKSLEEAGLMAATPLMTTDQCEYVKDGELFFAVTKRIKGEQVKASDMYEGDYTSKARYHGQMIGQLHLALKMHDDVICNDSDLLKMVKEWALPETKKTMTLSQEFEEDYIECFSKLYERLPKQIIHRNPHPGNIILSDGKLAGFMNFELTERNVRIFDPCYAATAILSDCFEANNGILLEKWIEIFNYLIDGYDSVAKLSNEEKKAIPYVVFSIQMIFVAYCRGIEKLEEVAKVNEAMFEWLIKNKHRLLN